MCLNYFALLAFTKCSYSRFGLVYDSFPNHFFTEPISCSVEGVSITNGTVLADGVVVMGSQSVGTVITYQCDPGYVLSGSTQRTCEIIQGSPNGEWSGLLPSCTEGVDIPESSLDATVSPSATTTPVPSSTGKRLCILFQHCTTLAKGIGLRKRCLKVKFMGCRFQVRKVYGCRFQVTLNVSLIKARL